MMSAFVMVDRSMFSSAILTPVNVKIRTSEKRLTSI
jgi:hypothetical protein